MLGWLVPAVSFAQDPAEGSDWQSAELPRDLVRLYGFVDGYVEKVANTPVRLDDGTTGSEANPHEFDVLNLHIMSQGVVFGKYRFFVNLAAPGSGGVADEPVSLRNAWVEAPLSGELAMFRIGKTYRRFGLYNEQLDAVPTFIGIEPPELFDKDHLMVTRTTNAMLHGRLPLSSGGTVAYALMTGNDERAGGQVPLGADVRYEGGGVTVGTSFYSTLGDAVPTVAVGEGPPAGGVAAWMASDRYLIYGGFLEVKQQGLILQVEGWQARHDAVRDPSQVLALLDAGLNPTQLDRFGLDGAAPTAADVRRRVRYTIETGYVRSGYSFDVPVRGGLLEVTPYAQFDFYSNPESIQSKDYGGDNEAGFADDGRYYKPTVGTVFRPVPSVAFKLDGSAHVQQFNGALEYYPEVRFSYSMFWDLWNR